MYIRFVVPQRDAYAGVEAGIFHVTGHVLSDQSQPLWLRTLLRQELDWFNTHLPIPDRLWLSFTRRKTRYGICWFRPSAHEPISHARTVQWLMADAGYPVENIYTDSPGTIYYSDDWQIVAQAGYHVPMGFD